MTDVINYLNQYQAQQPNMLDSYDDTQGMPRQRPADPLRWLADYVGQNKDLPAPQFFMDPRALSVRNMLHSGLGTAANWLDGTKDPSLVGPAEMVSPLGLAGMGTGLANALTRAAPDARIAQTLARQYPEEISAGSIHRGQIAGNPRVWVDGAEGTTPASVGQILPASNPTSARFVTDFGMIPGRSAPITPANANIRGPVAVMADNAKGSAPGTVINSLDMSEAARMARAREQGFDTGQTWYHGTGGKFDEFKPRSSAGGVYMTTNPAEASRYADIATRAGGDASVLPLLTRGSKIASTSDIDAAEAALMKSSGRGYVPTKEVYAELERRGFEGWRDGDIAVTFDPRNIRSTQAAFDPAKRDSANLLAASPSASAPGLAANSTQQQESAGTSGASGFGDFLHRTFVDGTVPLSSDENEWAEEMRGTRERRMYSNEAKAREMGRKAGKVTGNAIKGVLETWDEMRPGTHLQRLFEKYGTAGPVEPPPQNRFDFVDSSKIDSGVMDILKKYGLAD